MARAHHKSEGLNQHTKVCRSGLAVDKTGSFRGALTLVDRNLSGTLDIAAKIQTGRRTMHALMGAGAYGCSGVTPLIVPHLWKIYALPRMTYGLEVFELVANIKIKKSHY